mmetsp:Transcript_51377/g.129032  ORF Transcript_51377/g.129032 Transcript_51377/m.129032 type:complete len:242 (-) Transcript_51377:606-1331(-)
MCWGGRGVVNTAWLHGCSPQRPLLSLRLSVCLSSACVVYRSFVLVHECVHSPYVSLSVCFSLCVLCALADRYSNTIVAVSHHTHALTSIRVCMCPPVCRGSLRAHSRMMNEWSTMCVHPIRAFLDVACLSASSACSLVCRVLRAALCYVQWHGQIPLCVVNTNGQTDRGTVCVPHQPRCLESIQPTKSPHTPSPRMHTHGIEYTPVSHRYAHGRSGSQCLRGDGPGDLPAVRRGDVLRLAL